MNYFLKNFGENDCKYWKERNIKQLFKGKAKTYKKRLLHKKIGIINILFVTFSDDDSFTRAKNWTEEKDMHFGQWRRYHQIKVLRNTIKAN